MHSKRIKRFRQHLHNAFQKFRLRYLQPGRLTHLPDTLTIELTSHCSLACSCCPNGIAGARRRGRDTITLANFKKLLENIDVPVRSVFLHLHGEPFLNKDLPEIVRLLAEHGVEEFNIFSNAYNIKLDLLENVLCSVGGKKLNLAFSAELYDRQAYEHIRCPGRFDTVWQSLQDIDAMMQKHGTTYSVNSIVHREDIGILPERVPDVFRRLPSLKSMHLTSAFPWPHLPQTGDLAGHLRRKRSICNQIWQLPAIMADGRVTMCSSDYNAECVVGSLYEEKFSKIINNKAARAFRRNIALRRPESNALCKGCLIDRHTAFSRIVNRKFVEKAAPEALQKYFAAFGKYFNI